MGINYSTQRKVQSNRRIGKRTKTRSRRNKIAKIRYSRRTAQSAAGSRELIRVSKPNIGQATVATAPSIQDTIVTSFTTGFTITILARLLTRLLNN